MRIADILLTEQQSSHFPTNVGAVHIKMHYVPEQEKQMQAAGFKPPSEDIYVVHAHALPYDQHDTMDRLKKRGKYAQDSDEYLISVIDQAIEAVRKVDSEAPGKWEQTKAAIRQLQAFMKHGKRVIVVPIPSSGPTSKLVAQRLAAAIGSTVVEPLSKNTHPPLSYRQLYRDHPEQDFSKEENPAEFFYDMKHAEKELNAAIEANDERKFDYWDKEYEALKKRYENYKYSRKKYQYSHNAHLGRAFYDTIAADDHAKQLHGAYIILVDDNVMQGHTVSEAVKALWLKGIVPKGIIGFVPHKFVSTPH